MNRIILACGIISRCERLNDPIVSDGFLQHLGPHSHLGLGSDSIIQPLKRVSCCFLRPVKACQILRDLGMKSVYGYNLSTIPYYYSCQRTIEMRSVCSFIFLLKLLREDYDDCGPLPCLAR